MSSLKKTRNSSVELLRIISMLTIVAIHYMGANNLDAVTSSSWLETESYIALKTILNYGVNIFVIITGYYMSTKTEVSVRKIIKLLFDITFYGVCIYCVGVIIGVLPYSTSDLVKSAVPVLAGQRWFVKAYIVLFLLAPFISKLISIMDQKSHYILIVICSLFISFWPSFLPNPPIDDYGFGFVNFIFLYIVAGYLRKYIKNISSIKCLAVFCGVNTSPKIEHRGRLN